MRTAVLALFTTLAACGGTVPAPAPVTVVVPAVAPARAPADVTASSPSSPSRPQAAVEPAEVAGPADAPTTAKAFFDAIAGHDERAAGKLADPAIARHAKRDYADATGAVFEGPAKPESWPHLPDQLLAFEGTFTGGSSPSRVVVALQREGKEWRVIGVRDLDDKSAKAKGAAARPAAPPTSEAHGKLLSKPKKGSLDIELADGTPAVGDNAVLTRKIDRSVPFVGGAWLVIAKTQVTKVVGKKVTLKVLEEQAVMKMNGRKLDHFTVGVPVGLKWTAAAPTP